MKLFPHAMIRISGGPFEKLESLDIIDAIQIIDAVIDHKKKLVPLKQTISDELYQIISRQPDPSLQNLMVKVRRDIFNERDITADKITKITPHLPIPLGTQIENYRRLKEEINRLWEEGEALFCKEVTAVREKLKRRVASDENFRKGLLLGSQSLYKRVPGYIAQTPSARMKKKDAQVERGIVRYFSRMHGKTSPFSTFTNLAIGKITSNPQPPLPKDQISPFVRLKQPGEVRVVYHIRLNNYLYNYLKVLLTKNAHIYPYLLVRANPTIQQHKDHYLYLTNSNNIEAFQRIPANPALEMFRYLTAEKKEGLIYKDLIRAIIDNEYIDAPPEDLEAFAGQLIAYGF
ncbi:MAG TPA: lantibiotic dehydratase, partial [Candidatus Deferrimicrobium sp.]|nr:lantibiotic dehydratase [Candidatus Deferrimicrobium sp.]